MKDKALLGLIVLTMFFCMMRAPLSCLFLSCAIALIHYSIFNKSKKNILPFVFVAMGICSIFALLSGKLDANMSDFMYSKFISVTDSHSNLISERVNLKYDFYLWGDGAGRHAIPVDTINPNTSIRDSEWVKIIVEQGYIGFCLYVTFFVLLFLKAIANFKYLPIELCILMFFAVTMIGADSLSSPEKSIFLFWLAAGRISAFQRSKYNKPLFVSDESNV